MSNIGFWRQKIVWISRPRISECYYKLVIPLQSYCWLSRRTTSQMNSITTFTNLKCHNHWLHWLTCWWLTRVWQSYFSVTSWIFVITWWDAKMSNLLGRKVTFKSLRRITWRRIWSRSKIQIQMKMRVFISSAICSVLFIKRLNWSMRSWMVDINVRKTEENCWVDDTFIQKY